jgi:ribosomal protein S9
MQKSLENQGILRLLFAEYGLKAARRAPQFSKR